MPRKSLNNWSHFCLLLVVDLSVDHAYLGARDLNGAVSSSSSSPSDQEVPRLQVLNHSAFLKQPVSRRKVKSSSPSASAPKVTLAPRGTPSISSSSPGALPRSPPLADSDSVVIDITLENGRILPSSHQSTSSPSGTVPPVPQVPSQSRVEGRVPDLPAHWTRPRPPSPFNSLLDFANIVVSFERVTEQDSQVREPFRARLGDIFIMVLFRTSRNFETKCGQVIKSY